jgi:cation diffusion facilitator family transporter
MLTGQQPNGSDPPTTHDRRGRSRLVVVVAVVADGVVTVFKFVAAAVTGSASMLAEGLHSASEATNQGLLLRGFARARRGDTPEHPFGHSRERYFWALVVSFLIFGVGSAAAFFEAYAKFRNSEPIVQPLWAYAVLTAALVLDGGSFVVARRQAKRERRGSMLRYLRESKIPEVSVVMLQDAAAVIGIAIAYTAISLSLVTDEPAFDAAGSAAIGSLLAAVAFTLVWRVKSLLIGEAAPSHEFDTIRDIILGQPSVRELISLRTLYHGPDELVVESQVSFDPDMRVREVADVIDAIEDAVRTQLPSARLVAIEPAVARMRDPDVPEFQRRRLQMADRGRRV